MKELLFYSFLTIYIIFSLIQSAEFCREDKFYSRKKKLFHLILIWLIPFVYALLLSELIQKTKGSFDPDKKPKSLGHKGKMESSSMGGGHDNFDDN